MRQFALLIAVFTLAACGPKDEPAAEVSQQPVVETETEVLTQEAFDLHHDYFSFANTDQFVTEHLALDLSVDFDKKELRGSAVLNMQRLDPVATEIILDTRDLHIESVVVNGVEASYEYSIKDKVLGQALKISVPPAQQRDEALEVEIHYATDPTATALQWLPADLTAGGEHPFMFSQSQSIHARSWVPLQDSPAVRMTYEAIIHTPENLLAVMSANNDPEADRNGEYQFSMPQAIPSYLLAIAVGNIYFAPIGEQTGIYSEPEVLDASVFEFSNTQNMLEMAEDMYGPYQWGRYDLLILPPSFPFGGMENPRLSFITPSVLAGDRSLVSLIAHELAHSWSGNLVTNQTWRYIWLNEGITSYVTSRLMEVLYSKDRADEERVLAYRELQSSMQTVKPDMQALAPLKKLVNPDESQGSMHYDKGELFMQHLENVYGREAFDPFLAGYFKHFEFESITTEQFLAYLDENLLQKYPGKYSRAQAEQWTYEPAIPADSPMPQSDTLDAAGKMAKSWAVGELAVENIPQQDFSPQATVYFINNLPLELNEEQLAELDNGFGFSQSLNAEIARTWFIQVATRRYQAAYPEMRAYLNRYGRTRLVKPVYEALAKNGQDAELSREVFDAAKAKYHPLTKRAIANSLDSISLNKTGQ
jgi:hypothetical protein